MYNVCMCKCYPLEPIEMKLSLDLGFRIWDLKFGESVDISDRRTNSLSRS